MKPSLLSLALCLVVFSAGSQSQQVGDPPVQFIKVAPSDVEIDPWITTVISTHQGTVAYDDQAVDRTVIYDGHPLKSHIVIRSVGSAINERNTLTPYLARLVKREGGAAYSPQFSPDGRFVLFKYGGIGSDFPFEIYVLDVQRGVIKRVEDSKGQPYLPVFQELRWSPDSNYIAWVENLGLVGDRLDRETPGALRVCNWRTGQSYIVATGDEVRYSFSWAAPHTLLWSQLPHHPTLLPAPPTSSSPADRAPERLRRAGEEPLVKEHPASFEVDVADPVAKPHRVLSDAFRAVVSPSGKKMAFFGSYDVSKPYPLSYRWEEVAGSAMYLSVANRDGSYRRAINIQAGSYPQLLWQHDDKHLLSLEIEQTAAYDPQMQNKPGSFNITLRQFDVTAGKVKVLAASLPGTEHDRLLGVSSDDKIVYLYVNEALDLIHNSVYGGAFKVGNSIVALNLQTGERTTIAQTINALGLDWHEDNTAPTILK